jgi:hypothetical protein
MGDRSSEIHLRAEVSPLTEVRKVVNKTRGAGVPRKMQRINNKDMECQIIRPPLDLLSGNSASVVFMNRRPHIPLDIAGMSDT